MRRDRQRRYLGSDVGNRGHCDGRHPMDPRIAGTGGFAGASMYGAG